MKRLSPRFATMIFFFVIKTTNAVVPTDGILSGSSDVGAWRALYCGPRSFIKSLRLPTGVVRFWDRMSSKLSQSGTWGHLSVKGVVLTMLRAFSSSSRRMSPRRGTPYTTSPFFPSTSGLSQVARICFLIMCIPRSNLRYPCLAFPPPSDASDDSK